MSIVAIKNFGNIKGLFGMNFEMIILFYQRSILAPLYSVGAEQIPLPTGGEPVGLD